MEEGASCTAGGAAAAENSCPKPRKVEQTYGPAIPPPGIHLKDEAGEAGVPGRRVGKGGDAYAQAAVPQL